MLIDTKLRLSKMMWMVELSECLKNESNLYLRFPPSSFSFNGIAIWVFISNVSLCHMYSSEFSIYESFITSCLLTTLRDLSLLCLLENENDLVHLRWTLNCDRQGVRCHQPWAVSVSEKRWCVCVCVHARVRVFCVIISALLLFRGQKYFFFLYYKGTQNHCLLWIVTYFFIQIYQIEIINLSTFYAYFTLPNSLLPYSLFTFIHLYKILHCGHTFTISIAGGFSNACLHLKGDVLLRKGQRSLKTNSLLPPRGINLDFLSSSLLSASCSLPFHSLSQIHIRRCFEHNTNTTRANYNCAWISLYDIEFLVAWIFQTDLWERKRINRIFLPTLLSSLVSV